MTKRRGQVSGRGMIQEFGLVLIMLNRLYLGYYPVKVGYLYRSSHVAYSLWDVFSIARA